MKARSPAWRPVLRPRGRQRGVAVITALLLTTLAVTIVASLFWQQQVQVRSIENQRLHLQTKWILRGALDWSRLILQQDLRDSNFTAETGVWATPLAETRLDDYVERERLDNERYDATLSGRIRDAQGRYNLGNLAKGRKVNAAQAEVFGRLLANLQLNPALAARTANLVASGQKADGAPPAGGGGEQGGTTALPVSSDDGEPVEMMRVEDLLAVSGFTPQAIERLREFVIVLPATSEITKINVNMAAPELLAAIVKNFSVSEATVLAQFRKRSPFFSDHNFTEYLGNTSKARYQGVEVGVQSNYFLVQSHIRLGRAALDAEALIQRYPDSKRASVVWIREN